MLANSKEPPLTEERGHREGRTTWERLDLATGFGKYG